MGFGYKKDSEVNATESGDTSSWSSVNAMGIDALQLLKSSVDTEELLGNQNPQHHNGDDTSDGQQDLTKRSDMVDSSATSIMMGTGRSGWSVADDAGILQRTETFDLMMSNRHDGSSSALYSIKGSFASYDVKPSQLSVIDDNDDVGDGTLMLQDIDQ